MVERSDQSKGGSSPRARVGQWLGYGFGFYQIELQHLAGFYLRTTIREQERKKKCNGLVEDGVDHYRVGWVHRNINWTRYRQVELERWLALITRFVFQNYAGSLLNYAEKRNARGRERRRDGERESEREKTQS